MLLAIDMGNTNITLGVFNNKELQFESRIATDKTKMRDQYAVEISNIFELYNIDANEIQDAIISSVVPSLDKAIMQAVESVCEVKPLMVGPGIKTGMNIRIDNPAQLGADLLVGAVAASKKYGTPCIIWDLGTATTVSVVSEDGSYLGGSIMAGIGTSLNALIEKTSLLPNIRLEKSPKVIGTNTTHCMQSGIVYSTAAMVDGMNEKIQDEIGQKAFIVMTGGLGNIIVPSCQSDIIYDENLLLDGLQIIYERNIKG